MNSIVSRSPSRLDRPRLVQHGGERDRALADRREDDARPELLHLVEAQLALRGFLRLGLRGRLGLRCRLGRGLLRLGRGSRRRGHAVARPRLDLVEAVGERLPREVGAGPRHLHERELERQPRVAALARVLDRDREQVDQPQDGRLTELVRLRAQPLARLVGDGQRVRHLAHVLDEEQVAEVLEQVVDEPVQVLALVGELLDEEQETRRVAVDDQVADPEERLLLDRAEQLEHAPAP